MRTSRCLTTATTGSPIRRASPLSRTRRLGCAPPVPAPVLGLRCPTNYWKGAEVDSRIDYAHSHPLTALANELRIERRSIENRPYYVLRLLLALLPFTAIALVGPLIVSRDLALTVASALLGVQLAGPYARWSAGVIRLLRNARHERRHPVGLLGSETRSRLGRRTISMRISFIPAQGGLRIKSPTTKGMSHVRARLIFRSRLEPSWRRYFLDFDARLIVEGIPLDPVAVIRANYNETWWIRGVIRKWYKRGAIRTLKRVGRTLLQVTLKDEADAPARTLAQQLRIPYPPGVKRRERVWRRATRGPSGS